MALANPVDDQRCAIRVSVEQPQFDQAPGTADVQCPVGFGLQAQRPVVLADADSIMQRRAEAVAPSAHARGMPCLRGLIERRGGDGELFGRGVKGPERRMIG
ncbi:hypothetical protein D3C76_1563750 [compost metagenome]